MSEIPWWNFESNENIPKLKQATPEEVSKVKDEVEYSNKLIKVNNVLDVLDFPDNIEEKFRGVLEKQDDKTLIELASKQKTEILSFIKNQELNINSWNSKELDIENQKNDSKISKLESIFTPELLQEHITIKEQFDKLENTTDKEPVFREIINILKNEPWTLKAIIDSLWWANPNNPQYLEFKNTLIDLDPSFKDIFLPLEKIHNKTAFDTAEIINNIEKSNWWIIDIDLKSQTSKMSLIDSEYAFEEKLDMKALSDINTECAREVDEFKNANDILDGAYAPFGGLLNKIGQNWDETNVSESVSKALSGFDMSSISELEWVYEDFNIDSNIQISQADINSLRDVTSKDELRIKVENIKDKFQKLKLEMNKIEEGVIQKYNAEFKELLQMEAEKKERKLEMLKFFNSIGFDILPKAKTDNLIDFINTRAWKFWLDSKIDLENGNIGFNKDFWNKEISTMEKKHFIELFNKMLWSDVVDKNIAYGTTSLSIKSISTIQKLGNKNVGFFQENMEKK